MSELLLKTSAQVSAAVQELDRLADTLGMPDRERRSILGLNDDAYRSWRRGDVDVAAPVGPELVRRLGYALPLMRRMVANTPMPPMGRNYHQPRPRID